MKRCVDCGEVKVLNDFYVNKPMPDGHTNQCKVCVRRQQRLHRLFDGEYLRERERERGRARHRGSDNRWRTPEKQAANNAVQRAVASGLLVRPSTCEICSSDRRIEAAHYNYVEKLRVRWLCARCHRRWDQGGPETRAALPM